MKKLKLVTMVIGALVTGALIVSLGVLILAYMINYVLCLSMDLGVSYLKAMVIAFSFNTILLITVTIATVLQIEKLRKNE